MRKIAVALFVLAAGCGAPPPPEPPPPPPPPQPEVAQPAPAPAPTASAVALTPEEEKYAKVVIKVVPVAGSVYMLEGAGGNIGVSVGDDGIVLVDDQFAPLASRIKEALKGITDKPIRVVLNTHWHFDHTGSNALFGGMAGAPIVAHENVRKRLESGAPKREIAGKSMDAIPPAPHDALPIITFHDKIGVHLNGEDIRALHLPAGHTDGDIVVHFVKSNVVHMGDDFVTYGFPFVDVASGGSVKGMVAALDKMAAELPADVKIIPGHGKLSTLDDVKKLSGVLKDCIKLVEDQVKKKKTLKEIQDAKVLSKYDDMGKGFIKADFFIETIFDELTAKKDEPPKKKPGPTPKH